jgi:cation transport ATPase
MTTRAAISGLLLSREKLRPILEQEGARVLFLSVGPLVLLWAIESSTYRFSNAPLLEGVLTAAVFFFGHRVLIRGFRSLLIDLRPTHDAATALGAAVGFGISFLLSALHAAGKLPGSLADPRGGPLLLFAPAATLLAARAAGRDLARPGLAALPEGTRPNAWTRAAGACTLGAVALALGLAIPWTVVSGNIVEACKVIMALLAALSLDLIPFVRGTIRSLAGAPTAVGPAIPWSVVERAAGADTVLFERGGVLTAGQPEVDCVHPIEGEWRREDILHLAAVAEYGIQHQIRDAVLRGYKANLRTVPNIKGIRYLPGRGVRASYQGRELCLGNLRLFREAGWPRDTLELLQEKSRQWSPAGETVLFISLGVELVGAISLRDSLRPDGQEAIEGLIAMGLKPAVLSGDTQESLQGLLAALPSLEIHGGVLPEERVPLLKKWRKEGRKVIAVGTNAFLATCGRAADICLRWSGADPAGAATGREGGEADPVPAIRSLLDIPTLISRARHLVARENQALAFAAGYQTLMMVVLTGALHPWLGIAPSPEIAAAFAATAPWCLAVFLHRGQPSATPPGSAVLADGGTEKGEGEPNRALEAREELLR